MEFFHHFKLLIYFDMIWRETLFHVAESEFVVAPPGALLWLTSGSDFSYPNKFEYTILQSLTGR